MSQQADSTWDDPKSRDDWNKYVKDFRYDRNVLKALLVSATREGSTRLPTIEEFILSEVVNGVIDYVFLDGYADRLRTAKTYQNFCGFNRNNFERELIEDFDWHWKNMTETAAKKQLHPQVHEAIQRMTRVKQVHAPPERPYNYCKLYAHFKGPMDTGICEVVFKSTFSLPHDVVVQVQHKILPQLSEKERKDVEGIAQTMKHYIEKDVEFIRNTYFW